jgi:hypothetical protein
LQQIPLGGEFTSLTGGTFPWLVDLPAGLSVEVQMQELSALGWTTKLRNVNCSTRLLIETPEESFYCAPPRRLERRSPVL